MAMTWRQGIRLLLLGAALLAAQPAPARAAPDPFEAVNRRIHGFNQGVQARLLGPLVEIYHATTTPEARRGLANALANLNEPVTAASGLAAGQAGLAWNAATRFGINSTLGLGGVEDRAAALGYPRRPFGVADALCAWRVPSGPFLVLPLLGPSTLRDAGAQFATTAALAQALGPDIVLAWGTGDALVGYAGIHHALARLEAESLDAYAVLRSAYRQRRAATCPQDRPAEAEDEEAAEPR
ncbi:MlaA family lipoprotein [Roseicella aerolata]|uniref:VacJ family lipoprotein n=1 Tax=Roseicella aerolata TaxID=2883479 RepID=A0A9X1IBY8_9PROT|nr:MlaA family lipoprotein [Roseicella aerolata]MCB4821431.1 VacJ family lipoprotein [Roseicella aerolata]